MYQESNKNDIIPGIFLAETFIPEGEDKIDKWIDIDRENYTFPSDSLYSLDKDTYNNKLLIFKEDIQESFKHLNLKIIGKLRYENGKLTDLKIDINVPLIKDTELIGLLQLTSTKLNTILLTSTKLNTISFDYIPVTIRIIDQKQDVGIIIWDPTENQIYATPI